MITIQKISKDGNFSRKTGKIDKNWINVIPRLICTSICSFKAKSKLSEKRKPYVKQSLSYRLHVFRSISSGVNCQMWKYTGKIFGKKEKCDFSEKYYFF